MKPKSGPFETENCNYFLLQNQTHNNSNKKFELMLTRRAKAYSSSCSQTVYLQPLRLSSFLKYALQPKIVKINKNSLFL